jgi:hypothetical protein
MPPPGTATFENLTQAIETQIINYCPASFPHPSTIWASIASDEEITASPPHDRFVIVRPNDFVADQGIVAGAGAGLFSAGAPDTAVGLVPLIWHVEVGLFVRLNLDQSGRDDSFLLDPSLGIFQLFRRIMGSLQLFMPTNGDATGTFMLEEPMRMVRGTLRPKRPRPNWGKLESIWETKFVCEFPGPEHLA